MNPDDVRSLVRHAQADLDHAITQLRQALEIQPHTWMFCAACGLGSAIDDCAKARQGLDRLIRDGVGL